MLENAAERSANLENQSRRELKKIKKLHSEQCDEMTEQIETVRNNQFFTQTWSVCFIFEGYLF